MQEVITRDAIMQRANQVFDLHFFYKSNVIYFTSNHRGFPTYEQATQEAACLVDKVIHKITRDEAMEWKGNRSVDMGRDVPVLAYNSAMDEALANRLSLTHRDYYRNGYCNGFLYCQSIIDKQLIKGQCIKFADWLIGNGHIPDLNSLTDNPMVWAFIDGEFKNTEKMFQLYVDALNKQNEKNL